MKKKIKWAIGILCIIAIACITIRMLLKYREESMYGNMYESSFHGKIIEVDEKKKEMVVEITSEGVGPYETISQKKGDRFFVEHYYSAHASAYEGPLRPKVGMYVSAYFWDDEQARQENGELEEKNGLPCLRDVAMSEDKPSEDGGQEDGREE